MATTFVTVSPGSPVSRSGLLHALSNFNDFWELTVTQTELVSISVIGTGASPTPLFELQDANQNLLESNLGGAPGAIQLNAGSYELTVSYNSGDPTLPPDAYSLVISGTAVSGPAKADLFVASIAPNATSVTQGQTFAFSYMIQDNSSAPVTVNTSTGIYLDGQRIKSDTTGTISANGSTPGNDSFSTAGLSVGQHTLTIAADDTQLVNEGNNEGNNTRSLTFNVTGVSQNHSPVITSTPTTAVVTEFVGKPSGTHQAIGTIAFTDLDLTDIHTASALKTSGASGFPADFFIQPATVAATGDGTGAVTWTYSISDSAIDKLAAGQVVPQVFTLTIDDGHGGTASQDITILLTGTNDAPVAKDDSLSVSENSAIAVLVPGILTNDTDVDGNNLTAVLAIAPSHGFLTFHPDGSFTYAPLTNYAGPDSFTYFANDGTTNSPSAATVSITVDHAPVFASSTFQFFGFAPDAGGWSSDDRYPRELADVNHDGMADIVGFGDSGVYVALATGGGSFGATSLKLSSFAPDAGGWSSEDKYPRELADVNGDGMADIVGFGESGVFVSLATGGGAFGSPTFQLASFGPNAGGWSSDDKYPRELADVNGDGMADIVGFGQLGRLCRACHRRRRLRVADVPACVLWSRRRRLEQSGQVPARAGRRERRRHGRHRWLRRTRASLSRSPPAAAPSERRRSGLRPSVPTPVAGAATTSIRANLPT